MEQRRATSAVKALPGIAAAAIAAMERLRVSPEVRAAMERTEAVIRAMDHFRLSRKFPLSATSSD